jgi:DNA-binding beta-propeller fold protein YncE
MLIGNDPFRFDMRDDWAKLPSGFQLGYTHGVVVDEADNVYVFNQSEHALVMFDRDGNYQSSRGSEFQKGAHGLFLDDEGGDECVYFTDHEMPAVVKQSIDGEEHWRMTAPPRPDLYRDRHNFKPTDVCVSPDGDVYVFDGYGLPYIHVFDRRRRYLMSIGGPGDGPGQLKTPHGGWIDTRKAEPELYVADRGNRRIQVFTLDGKHKRFITHPRIEQPCDLYPFGNELWVPDLNAHLVVLDANDNVAAVLGDNPEAPKTPGWPNIQSTLTNGKFNSCHGCCVDSRGDVYVVEWISTGRIIKLIRQSEVPS